MTHVKRLTHVVMGTPDPRLEDLADWSNDTNFWKVVRRIQDRRLLDSDAEVALLDWPFPAFHRPHIESESEVNGAVLLVYSVRVGPNDEPPFSIYDIEGGGEDMAGRWIHPWFLYGNAYYHLSSFNESQEFNTCELEVRMVLKTK